MTQVSLRDSIGIVPQDTVLFNDTIAYNIGYGRHDADKAAVEKGAGLAQIDHSVHRQLPEGYESQVGERGLKLRVARSSASRSPARSSKAAILVLDERTSALDSYTEKEIQDALERVSRGRAARRSSSPIASRPL